MYTGFHRAYILTVCNYPHIRKTHLSDRDLVRITLLGQQITGRCEHDMFIICVLQVIYITVHSYCTATCLVKNNEIFVHIIGYIQHATTTVVVYKDTNNLRSKTLRTDKCDTLIFKVTVTSFLMYCIGYVNKTKN